MESMVAAVALVVVIAALFLAAWGLRRREADEVHSVEGYRHTLDTLHELRQRSPGGEDPQAANGHRPPEPTGPEPWLQAEAAEAAEAGTVPGGPWVGRPVPHRVTRRFRTAGEGAAGHPGPVVRGRPGEEPTAVHQVVEPGTTARPREAAPGGQESSEGNGSRAPLVFDDVGGRGVGAEELLEVPLAPPRPQGPRTARRARRPSPAVPHLSGATAAVSLLAVMVAGLAAYVAYSQVTAPKDVLAHHHGAAGRTRPTPTTAPPTTSTTSPPLTPFSATAGGATYNVGGTTYTVDLVAAGGPCWVQVTSQDSGAVVFTGTLAQGQQQAIPASGTTVLNIGNPHALDVAVNHVAVDYPPSFATPFMMAFRPGS